MRLIFLKSSGSFRCNFHVNYRAWNFGLAFCTDEELLDVMFENWTFTVYFGPYAFEAGI